MNQKRKFSRHRKINLLVAALLLAVWTIGNLPDLTASLDRLLFGLRADTASFLFDLQAGPEATPCGDLCPQTALPVTPKDRFSDPPREAGDHPLPVLRLLLHQPSPTTPMIPAQISLLEATAAAALPAPDDDQFLAVVRPSGSPTAAAARGQETTPLVPELQTTDSSPAPSASAAALPGRRFIRPSGDLEALFTKYGLLYRVNSELLKKIAFCESTYNPQSVNHVYGGMYQFLASTWSATRREMGLDPDPLLRFTAEEAIKTAAYKISREGTWAWPVCGKV